MFNISRLSIFLACAFALAGLASAQKYAETSDEEPSVRLGKPQVSESTAKTRAIAFLKALNVVTSHKAPTCMLKQRAIAKHVAGSAWFIVFDRMYEVTVSGQSGRILRFADAPALDRISRSDMYQRGAAYQHAVRPSITHAPTVCLASPHSTWNRGGEVVGRLLPRGEYVEQPGGLPVLNASDTVLMAFDPRTGKLAHFSRSLDIVIKPTKAKLDGQAAARRVQQLAGKAHLARLPRSPHVRRKGPYLAYVVMEHAASDSPRYVPESDVAILVWAIPVKSGEYWIDAKTGNFLGGWTVQTNKSGGAS